MSFFFTQCHEAGQPHRHSRTVLEGAEKKAKEAAEKKANEEAAKKAAEQKAREETKRKEAEIKAKEEAEKKAKQESEKLKEKEQGFFCSIAMSPVFRHGRFWAHLAIASKDVEEKPLV